MVMRVQETRTVLMYPHSNPEQSLNVKHAVECNDADHHLPGWAAD